MRPHTIFVIFIVGPMLFFLPGCKKLVNVPVPTTQVTNASAFSADATAIAVLTGIYINLSNGSFTAPGTIPSLSIYAGLSADELTLWSGVTASSQNFYYDNNLSSTTGGFEYWSLGFYNIYACNAAIEGLNGSQTLTPAIKQQLLGEALFMRAYFYFYLVNLYGDLPLILTTDYATNAKLGRSSKTLIYQQIVTDLKEAKLLLSPNYLDATLLQQTGQRIRPTTWAAGSLLSRTYLYTGDWTDAAKEADTVINSSLFNLPDLNSVFLSTSTEAIWQLQPVLNFPTNTQDAYAFVIPSAGPNISPGNFVFISPFLLQSFEAGDQRRVNWVDSVIVAPDTFYFPFKYKVSDPNAAVSEFEMVFRLGEQYLIRSEAEANLNDLSDAANDLNMIRARAGLPDISVMIAGSQTRLLSAILHERQVELFTENGQRWLDLKRTGSVDSVMMNVTPQKAGTAWNTSQQLYPLPLTDIQADVNLIQNSGY